MKEKERVYERKKMRRWKKEDESMIHNKTSRWPERQRVHDRKRTSQWKKETESMVEDESRKKGDESMKGKKRVDGKSMKERNRRKW